MEKMKLSRNEYDAVVEKYREQNGYDEMSDEEKAAFDEKLDKVVECSEVEKQLEESETTDSSSEETSDSDKLRSELKEKYGYDEMSDEQKQAFNEKLDEIVGTEDNGEDDPGDNEIGAKVLRRSR
jgi:hypothetical protein